MKVTNSMSTKQKIIVSGIQPTGKLHLGNYLGAIKQWKELQSNPDYLCKFMVADLHAMTTGFNFQTDSFLEVCSTIADLQRCGIELRNVFRQSEQRGKILDFYWNLSCHVSIGQLSRMTQFKEKADKNKQNLGLFSYPVLMAADILALEADLVPVGEDQKQHLELTRKLAKKFELKIPEPLISKTCGRIMSLVDPTKKMSKSDPNDNSRINLSDSDSLIEKKVIRAATTEQGQINLQNIYNACGGSSMLDFSKATQAKQLVVDSLLLELRSKK